MLDRLTVVEVTIAMMRAMIIATVVEAPILAIAILVLAVITVVGQVLLVEAQVVKSMMNGMEDGPMRKVTSITIIMILIQEIHMILMEIFRKHERLALGLIAIFFYLQRQRHCQSK